MTDYVLAGLTKRRAELSGEADALHARLALIATDIGHLDAVIRQFDPDYDLASIRPKRLRSPDTVGRGERSRALLTVLRDAAEPITTADIVRQLMAKQGQDAGDRRLLAQITKRVGMALSRQKANGAVRTVEGQGQFVLWEVAR